MRIEIRRAEYQEVERMRDLYRQEVNCQLIHDSCLRRGIADAYLIEVDGRVGGYGGVWNKYDPDRLMEFYTLPAVRQHSLPIFRELLAASEAKEMEAQTNSPLMLLMLLDCATNIRAENFLFHDAFTSTLPSPGGVFRRSVPEDAVEDEWVIETEGVVFGGGYLCHYNPPYGDIYMGVDEKVRRKGYGSYLVQELKRVCYEGGRKPSARCNAVNTASRLTLQKAGMLPCGRLMVGDVAKA
jgi:GNAT superfamily N-acetyltransferase